MRAVRLLIGFVLSAIVFGLIRDTVATPGMEAAWTRLLLPWRLARLYAQPADPAIGLPVAGVNRTSISDTWKAARSGSRKHDGQDIFAPKGTPVVAATDGYVTKIGGGNLGGNAVFITGRGARTYYYAHLEAYRPGLAIGDYVNRGEIVGFVGNTGNARGTPSHLHFGVYESTGAMNPLPLLENSGAEQSPNQQSS